MPLKRHLRPANSNKKVHKMNGLRIQFYGGGGVYFMQKCHIPQKIFEPLWTGTVQGAILPHEDLLSKN
jgi:hypothetical protein